jgi:hypothetical protein
MVFLLRAGGLNRTLRKRREQGLVLLAVVFGGGVPLLHATIC